MNNRQHGMALIVVLWLIVLLGIMAAGHSRNTHTDTLLASRQFAAAKARGLAEAGINHTILEMLADNSDRHFPVDGSVFTVDVLNKTVTVAIRDATGLVDLNAANHDLIGAALRACGLSEGRRRDLVDAILDWRDRDDLSHLDGVEDDDYVAAGLPWTSRDGAFMAIDELRYLPGMEQALFERLAPLVTIHSRRGGINLEYAPPILIAALTGDEVEPATPLRERERTGTRRQGPRNGTFHIYASATAGSGTTASIEAVVRISRSAQRPFSILEWREPPRHALPPLSGVQG